MRKTCLFRVLVYLFISTCALAAGGDMGGTDPNGSAEHPYLIEDLADFDTFADSNNAATYWASGVHTKLMTNIDLSGRTYTTAVIAPDIPDTSTWGFDGIPFSGVFHGNGHVVSNLTIDASGTANSFLGLFGYIHNSGVEVENLGIRDITITGGSSSKIVGGLCGANSRGKIANCYTTGTVSGNNTAGGVCGWNYGWIMDSYATGIVNGTGSIGGLCGENNQASYIENCYTTSIVSGVDSVGGLCGRSSGGSCINSYFYRFGGPDNGYGTPLDDSQLLNRENYVGFDFVDSSGDGTNDNWSIVEGHCPKLSWQVDDGPLAPFALDLITTILAGTGYANDPFVISSYEDMMEFRTNPTLRIGYYTLTVNINLSGQIYTNAFVPERFIGYFDGGDNVISHLTINGEKNVGFFSMLSGEVANLGLEAIDISGTDNCGGLCGGVYSGSIIMNSYATGNISGDSYVGGLCGGNYGDIVDCYATGVVSGTDYSVGGLCGSNYDGSITNSYTSGGISGGRRVGGLCGYNNRGDIVDCHSTGIVNGTGSTVGGLCGINSSGNIMNCYATGAVSGMGDNVGGLCGRNYSSIITDSYATGNINGGNRYVGGLCGGNAGDIINCYATGAVSGVSYIGGLVGYAYGDTYTACFWDRDASGTIDGIGNQNPDPVGVTGKTTAEMQTQSTFTGWDFSTPVWMMLREGEDTPRLAWQAVYPGDIAGLYGADMVDFAYLSQHWNLTGCNSGTDCGRADIDISGDVGLSDLAYVAGDWLK